MSILLHDLSLTSHNILVLCKLEKRKVLPAIIQKKNLKNIQVVFTAVVLYSEYCHYRAPFPAPLWRPA
jgi:hypothetical protein